MAGDDSPNFLCIEIYAVYNPADHFNVAGDRELSSLQVHTRGGFIFCREIDPNQQPLEVRYSLWLGDCGIRIVNHAWH
jgi:hypothetical protein